MISTSTTTTTPSTSTPTRNPQGLQLDPDQYKLTPKESEFLKNWTKIDDDEELKKHVFQVQADAWEVFPYRCILAFTFTKLKISLLPAYPDLLKLQRSKPDALFIDVGCCFGNDTRKVVEDGYPVENVLATDLYPGFWELGHKLFKDTPETFPAHFIPGNVFDPNHLAPSPPFYSAPSTPRPTLSSLTSLTPLQGHISAIHTSSFFHLFTKDEQFQLAKLLATLLSPESGSMIFGEHGSQPTAGPRPAISSEGKEVYCYPPNDWKALWNGDVFEKGTVSVDAELIEVTRPKSTLYSPEGSRFYVMVWCVQRL